LPVSIWILLSAGKDIDALRDLCVDKRMFTMYITCIMNQPDLSSLIAENAALKAEVARLTDLVTALTEQLNWLKRQIFGQKSERVVPTTDAQVSLDLGDIQEQQTQAKTETITYTRTSPNANKTPHGREEIPAHIPRVIIPIKPEYDTTGMEQIGEKITEQLEYKAPEFFVKRYVRPVHATIENGERTLLCPALPPLCIEKGKIGPTVVAQTIISKCQDHLPHYRTAQMISRDCSMTIPESTIRDAFRQGIFLLEAISNRLKELALKSRYLQMDESTFKVIIHLTRGKTHLGYMWVRHAPPEKIVLFDYQKTRNVERGKKLLENFHGTLQTDGLDLYPPICKDLDLTHAGCMDHCRRGFEEALTNDNKRASQALDLIRPLYAVEETARQLNLTAAARLELRKEKSVPLFKSLIDWAAENSKNVRPKPPIGRAIIYLIERKEELGRFLEDGKIELSNILIENAIRPLAIGRKNYLYSGSEDGARRLATAYTIIGTCVKNGINIRTYLNHVLEELPKRLSKNIDDLLPINWKDPESIK
jgi:transposase